MRTNVGRLLFAWCALVALLLLLTIRVSGRDEPITLVIYPKTVVAGPSWKEIRATWLVERHPDNRKWSFVMVSDNGTYQLSEGDIQGEEDQRLFPTCTKENARPCYRRVTQGNYVFEACVYRIRNKKFCDKVTLEVN